MLEHLRLRPRRDEFQRVPFGVAEDKSSAGRKQLRQVFVVEQLLCERGGAAVHVFLTVRRVGQDQIELPAIVCKLVHCGKNVLRSHLNDPIIPRRGRVVADEFGVAVRFLNAQRRDRAAAQAFQAQRAAAGEQFQHPRADNPRAERVEDRLFDQIGRRSDVESFRDFQNPPRRLAAGNAHPMRVVELGTSGSKIRKLSRCVCG